MQSCSRARVLVTLSSAAVPRCVRLAAKGRSLEKWFGIRAQAAERGPGPHSGSRPVGRQSPLWGVGEGGRSSLC